MKMARRGRMRRHCHWRQKEPHLHPRLPVKDHQIVAEGGTHFPGARRAWQQAEA